MTNTLEAQGVVTATPDESFYLNRFKNCIQSGNWVNGRLVDEDYYCELYKGFAIVTWKREFSTPTQIQGMTKRTDYQAFVWEIGGFSDHLPYLSWLSQGVVTNSWSNDSNEKLLKKVRKKIDLLSLMYSIKNELIALSLTACRGIRYDEPHVFNATIGDVVAIRAFGRARLGKIVTTTGSRFVVAYMTPSNANDVHYKTLPLTQLFAKELKP